MNRKIREIEFCIDNNITQTQYTYLYIVYKSRQYVGNNEKLSQLLNVVRKYKNYIETNQIISDFEKDSLVSKGFLDVKEGTKIGEVKLTDKFLSIFVDDYIASNEFWEKYPAFLDDNGINFPLKGWDISLFRKVYCENINYEYEEHVQVMKDLDYAIANNLIRIKIESFVRSKAWLDIRNKRFSRKVTNLPRHTQNNL